MKPRSTIFVSGVSHEFGSFRDAVENEIEMKGCFAENQPGFPPDYLTVEEMLRRKLHDADAVIHIVGFRFGAEPNQRPAGIPRRSYTQMEFDIAREMQKPVYVFLSTDAVVRDPAGPDEKAEDAEATRLQLAHRQAVQNTNHLYYFFRDKAELCKLAAEIPPVAAADFHADISRIIKYAPTELVGRDDELKLLNDAWLSVRRAESPRPHVLTFVALGGEGKTSLVAKWAAELAHRDWPGCDAVFAWSFYSQGTREQLAASSDLFLKEALTFFGDPALAGSAAGAFDKGRRLAQLVGERRALLILDGLEPLQYAPTSPTPGELKDQGVAALLKGLAATSRGLCVVTTRYSLPDLKAFWQTTAPEKELKRLSRDAGVHLLKAHGVTGSDRRNIPLGDGAELVSEFEKLVEDVDGHALTLHIMGSFLKKAFRGDIRCRDRVTFEKASQKTDDHHAFRAMAAYEKWMEDGSDEAKRELAILRALGLFDRPATADCLQALLAEPAIPDLTEPLVGLPEDDWNCSLDSLETAKLLTVLRDAAGRLVALDAHPLIREYFAWRLKRGGLKPEAPAKELPGASPSLAFQASSSETGVAYRAAHRRLYEHLCPTTKEGAQPTLEDLQPLYQAVAHGCQAGLQEEVLLRVYDARIKRRNENYSVSKLGAFGQDLGALACFFETPWSKVSPELTTLGQAWVLGNTAACLRAMGRLREAIEPMRAGTNSLVAQENWMQAAINTSNLSALELTLGEVAGAVGDAEQSVTYADRSRDAFQRMSKRTTHANALHQAGRRAEAEVRFREAEALQAESQPDYPLLYSVQGFRYCDVLLTEAERAAWQTVLASGGREPAGSPRLVTPASETPVGSRPPLALNLVHACRDVEQRAAKTLKWVEGKLGLLTIALDHLTLGRAAFYAAILQGSEISNLKSEIEQAVAGLRRSGNMDDLPRGLLTRAWLRFVAGERTGAESAQSDLDEAWEIAERGAMKLFLADIHLHRARLFGVRAIQPLTPALSPAGRGSEAYPWESPAADLAAAEKLINTCGYHRRDEELQDAKLALLGRAP